VLFAKKSSLLVQKQLIGAKAAHKMLVKSISVVNFINVLHAAFTHSFYAQLLQAQIPKAQK